MYLGNHKRGLMIKHLEKQNKHNLIGAEIGVAEGGYADRLFKQLDIGHLYLIDPYYKYIQKGEEKDLSESKELMFKLLKKYEDRYTLYEMTSEKAHSLVDDDSLDFVYIDGNHQFSFVLNDIKWWSKKVKSGGVIGGHDALGLGVLLPTLAYALSMCRPHHLRISMSDWWIVKK